MNFVYVVQNGGIVKCATTDILQAFSVANPDMDVVIVWIDGIETTFYYADKNGDWH